MTLGDRSSASRNRYIISVSTERSFINFMQFLKSINIATSFIFHFLHSLNATISGSFREAEFATDTEIINKLLNQGYDWRVRPPGTNLSLPGSHGPVVVSVNMLIRSISKIDDVNMEYSVQMTFRETWVDGRLAYGLPRDNKPDFLILTAGQQIWMPDSFFQRQNITRIIVSNALAEYKWKSNDPVQLKDGLNSSLPSFQLNNVRTTYCTSTTNTGSYSCLRTVLELRRQFSYYLLQLYIPSTMLVIVSWVSFWLDRTAVPARVTLGVTTLLTMTTQASGINAKLPPVSYTKAIDIWIGGTILIKFLVLFQSHKLPSYLFLPCLFFIFGALLEFAWVTYVSSRAFFKGNKESKKKSNVILSSQPLQTHLLIANTNALDCDQEEPWLRFGTHSSTRLLDRMECGEVWVKQHNSSEDRGEVIVLNGGTTRRQPHRPALQLVSTINALIRWLRNKFDIDDRAKRADYISSKTIYFYVHNFETQFFF
ncbi:unnamed protein product [Anisakis simplex]|uniref:GluClalpha (inferred by orthology to a D. melanogaster protein) n=1 Tax=Anisakis simplex TaxID=6269 RepID=A0A0M3K316_ANISI|nr:unnamed protein product [Anisakis simplex]